MPKKKPDLFPEIWQVSSNGWSEFRFDFEKGSAKNVKGQEAKGLGFWAGKAFFKQVPPALDLI